MNKAFYLLSLLPLLLIPVSYATLPDGLSFDEFCDGKINDAHATAADVICELDIFAMHEDIIDIEDRVHALEAANISNYTKYPIISNVVITTDNNEFVLDYTVTSFHERTKLSFIAHDGKNRSMTGMGDTYGIGVFQESYGPDDMSWWSNGTGTFDVYMMLSHKLIYTETFVIP